MYQRYCAVHMSLSAFLGKKVLSLDLANLNLGQNAAVSIAELYNRQKTNVKHITLQDNPNFGSESLKYVLMCLDNQCALTSINLRNIGMPLLQFSLSFREVDHWLFLP